MPPKFGTSGLRGLVTDLTPDLVQRYVRAFLAACPQGGAVHVGRDLRASSPEIAAHVIAAVRAAGLDAVDHGALPTPALALASMSAGDSAVMITGSHIPADRNGLKFYVPSGEVSKTDEAAILAALETGVTDATTPGGLTRTDAARTAYTARYTAAFGARALVGTRLGIYQHSSVARDTLVEIVEGMGATAIPLARSDTFVPVDTEAVDAATRATLAGWARDHALDAILSTDGDADRPMLTDATGAVIPGDVLGALTARALGARTLVTPVSSNTMVEAMGFDTVTRTRIGSPFVIAGMEAVRATDPEARVAGYEANGGFLLGYTADAPAGPLPALMTRDSVLPMIAPLAAASAGLAALVAGLPGRFTAADRVQEVPADASAAFIGLLRDDPSARAAFFEVGAETALDLTDGLRVTFQGGDIVHLRPSGNAPECRCYAEAASAQAAAELVRVHLAKLRGALS